jgi:hypothetical protein
MTALVLALIAALLLLRARKVFGPRPMASRLDKPRLRPGQTRVSAKPVIGPKDETRISPAKPAQIAEASRPVAGRAKPVRGVLTARELGVQFPDEWPDWCDYQIPTFLRRRYGQGEDFGLDPDNSNF